MSIEFLCPECDEAIRLVDTVAGLHARCPHCLVTVPVPAAGSAPLPKRRHHPSQEGADPLPTVTPAPHPPDAAHPASPSEPAVAAAVAPPPPTPHSAPAAPGSPTLTFRCPECRTRLTVHDDLTGLHTRCPTCRAKVLVPAVSEASAAGWFGWVRKLFGRQPAPPAAPGPSP